MALEPEQVALGLMGQIDPTSEALRQKLGGSYLDSLTAHPTAEQLKSYLQTYGQVDPTGSAAREALGKQIYGNFGLGSQLDPSTQREVSQATRQAQQARGNVYGTSQLVAEAMARGSAGEARKQQRQQDLLGYLQSGQTTGDVAYNLYNRGQSNMRDAQSGALSYLSSGQTPYQVGANFVNQAEGNAANAAQGGPQYNPAALSNQYNASQFPQYGLQTSQNANAWYNSLNAYSGGAYPTKNRGAGAAAGALTGAVSGASTGAMAGSIIPGVGTLIGGIAGGLIGGIGGGVSGYYG